MRKTKVIREEQVAANSTFIFDVPCQEFEFITVTWTSPNSNTTIPIALILCPTSERGGAPLSNFPGMPAPPPAGACSYAALGPNCNMAFPLPDLVSVGVVTGAGGPVNVKVVGWYYMEAFPEPGGPERHLS